MIQPSPPVPSPPVVGSTDLWKLAGLVLVIVDHTGLFFAPETEAWRVLGRCAAPIFFFFIGYARTHTVPWTWLVLGGLLTATDHLTSADRSEVSLNILLNFALLRTALPHAEAWIAGRSTAGEAWRLAVLVGVCTAAIPVFDPFLEYGAEGWLWALFGLSQRRASEAGSGSGRGPAWIRNGVAAATALAYIVRESRDYELEGVAAFALAGLIVVLAGLLARFRRVALERQPPPALARALTWIGRRSLELYAASLFLMQVTAYAIGPEHDGEDEDDEE